MGLPVETIRVDDSQRGQMVVYRAFRVFRRRLRVPESLAEEDRDGVRRPATTELVLAFPCHDAVGAGGYAKKPGPMMLFAFLPVCCAGFPFALHADFDLVSSREGLQTDSAWNVWLRDQLPAAFAEAVRGDTALREEVCTLLHSQTSNVLDPFWQEAVDEMMRKMRGEQCILTEDGEWVKPHEAFLRGPLPPALVSCREAKQALGKSFASPDHVSAMGLEAACALGCVHFDAGHLVAMLERWVEGPSPALLSRPGEWMVRLYAHLHQKCTEEQTERLMSLPIFRTRAPGAGEGVEGVVLLSLDEETLFAELSEEVSEARESEAIFELLPSDVGRNGSPSVAFLKSLVRLPPLLFANPTLPYMLCVMILFFCLGSRPRL